ncbi:PucR family transcriptional regulator ligand-binding domain-containing protein [Streptomyces sp. NPDC001927]
MQVDHLLRLDRLDLSLVWGDEVLLAQEIGGVTATDLEDPARFLQPGEVVLSGLVWWAREDEPAKTDRFVSALREAGAVALLAGEETHGEVPSELADACRRHRIAVLAVPARTSFRAITEAVYLRQWGELSRRPTDHYALPENVRVELDRTLERGAPVGELFDRAFDHLGLPACHLLTGSGRTVARTATAPELPVRRAAEALRDGPARPCASRPTTPSSTPGTCTSRRTARCRPGSCRRLPSCSAVTAGDRTSRRRRADWPTRSSSHGCVRGTAR